MKRLRPLQITLFILLAIFMYYLRPQICTATTVQLEWRIISASHKKGEADPRLKDIYRNLGRVFNYNAYRLISSNRFSMSLNQPVSIPISKNSVCIIKIIDATNKWVHVQVRILRGDQTIFRTTVRLMNGRTLLLGGPSSRGNALIFSLRSFW